MTTYLVGTRLLATVTVTDTASGLAVDPASFAFRLVAPTDSATPLGTYAWNGTTWTNSESTIAVPAHVATGIFTLRFTVPYVNAAAGQWHLGWKSVANGSGEGEGSGELTVLVRPSGAL